MAAAHRLLWYSFCSAQEKCVSLAEPIQRTVTSVRAFSCWICCPFYKISKLRGSNYIFHGCLVSAFNISWCLRDVRVQCSELCTAYILSQYHIFGVNQFTSSRFCCGLDYDDNQKARKDSLISHARLPFVQPQRFYLLPLLLGLLQRPLKKRCFGRSHSLLL